MKKLILLLMVSVLFIHADFTVSYAGGKNFLLRDGGKTRLKTGTALNVTDTVVTGPRSFVAIRSDDGSVYKVLANTTARLDSYANDEVERKASFTLSKGKIFSFVSKTFKKSDVKFYTSNGVVGVRGTSFLLDNSNDNLKVYLTEGSVAIYETDNVSTPVGVISAGQVAEKAGGEALVKVTPLTQSQLDQATQEIPTSVQELNDNFDNSDALDGEEVSVDAELTEGDADAIAASDLDETSKEENISISEEINVANQETEEIRSKEIKKLKLLIDDTIREVNNSVEQNEEEIADHRDVKPKTIDGYKVTQYYAKNDNAINISSVSSKNDLVNTFNLTLNYENGFDADAFNANTPPSDLTSSILSIIGHNMTDNETWGITYVNSPDGRTYNVASLGGIGNVTLNGNNSNVDPSFIAYDDSGAVYNSIFLTGMTVNYAGRYPLSINYKVDLGDRVLDNSSNQRELFNRLYPNVEGVEPNRNIKVTLSADTAYLFGGRITEAYYFTDGFRDYLAPLFDNPVTGSTP